MVFVSVTPIQGTPQRLSHGILGATLRGKYHNPRITDELTEVWRC